MTSQQALMNDALSPHTPSPLSADADATVTGTDIIYLADLQPQPVEWLWQHRLAAGTLAMLSGEPGSGKTWVALAIAAALTRKARWPNKLLGHLGHLHETNDLFGNVANWTVSKSGWRRYCETTNNASEEAERMRKASACHRRCPAP
jgi:hypothetical protein